MATDYSNLGSFATGNAASLNGDLIQKLYDAEAKSRVDPITTRLELIDKEETVISDINTKINELISSVRSFDLYTSGSNAFEQVTATATGDSALFDAADVTALKTGTTTVEITELAQKDVYQSLLIADTEVEINAGTLSIDIDGIGGEAALTFDTTGITYEELLANINATGQINASLEQVSDTESRLIIKSQEVGLENALTISGTAAIALQYDQAANHMLTAQNMEATVDGVAYNVSSNTITIDGNLKITAAEKGISSVSVQSDTSSIVSSIQDIANIYNELVLMITEELYSEEASVQDTSSLKSMLSDIKNMMYGEYGTNDSSLLNFGFGFTKEGLLEIDSTTLNKALIDDPDSLKDLFIGVAEDEGFGTALKSMLDDFNSYGGLFDTLESGMDTRKTNLTEDKEQAVKNLDTKYDTMAAQFAAYASIISQMESSFGGLQMMIEQSTSGN